MNMPVTQIYFSPSGNSAGAANAVAAVLAAHTAANTNVVVEAAPCNPSDNITTIDLLKNKTPQPKNFGANEVLVISLPVFSGRLPENCLNMLKGFTGTATPAVAIVTYGNREYEDALLELTNILQSNGFIIAGAAAVVGRHSIFPQVAAKRTDAADKEKLANFAQKCAAKIANNSFKNEQIQVKGNTPYRDIMPVPLQPKASRACTECGICASLCPTGAINKDNPKITNKELCIACTACIYACPNKARSFKGLKYFIGGKAFAKKCSARKEPEFFV